MKTEDVSYDVESLFIEVAFKETIEYIDKSVKPFSKKSISKKLLGE